MSDFPTVRIDLLTHNSNIIAIHLKLNALILEVLNLL